MDAFEFENCQWQATTQLPTGEIFHITAKYLAVNRSGEGTILSLTGREVDRQHPVIARARFDVIGESVKLQRNAIHRLWRGRGVGFMMTVFANNILPWEAKITSIEGIRHW